MILRARQSRFPFIVLAIMEVVVTLSCIWTFFRMADYSILGILRLLELLAMFYIAIYFLKTDFRKGQAVELTDVGVWSLVWTKPTRSHMLPRLERNLLKWTDVEKWKMTAYIIYLYGAHRRVVINTILFEDGREVVRFINKATKADG